VLLPLRPEQGWKPDFEAIDSATWARIRLMVLGFPHNPNATTGEATTGAPTLVASAGFGGTSSPGQVPDSATQAPPIASTALPLTGTPKNLIYSSWGLIFE